MNNFCIVPYFLFQSLNSGAHQWAPAKLQCPLVCAVTSAIYIIITTFTFILLLLITPQIVFILILIIIIVNIINKINPPFSLSKLL